MKAKVNIEIKSPLRQFAENRKSVESEGRTVKEALDSLVTGYPKLGRQLFKETNQLNDFINIFVNGSDIRSQRGLDTTLKENDRLIIMPAIAGGADGHCNSR